MYYNTTNRTGLVLKQELAQAKSQKDKIYTYYEYAASEAYNKLRKGDKNGPMLSPSQVKKVFPKWPITSIRRAITDLTSEGKLEKTDKTRAGLYGKQEYMWRVAR